jgi:hypothetical protein
MASTRKAERARRSVSRWCIGPGRFGDHTHPSDNQTDPGPVLEIQGLAEKHQLATGTMTKESATKGYAALRGMYVSSQTHSTVAAA